jgi:DNA-binding response OmpR family regulator
LTTVSAQTENAKRILIVDDDESMRLLLAEYFRRLGYDVIERKNGAEAFDLAIVQRFDCFIFDVTMPGMSGLELLRRVREREVWTPALFLTARDEISDKEAGFKVGADDYLAKPFNPRELELRVEALIRRGGGGGGGSGGGRAVFAYQQREGEVIKVGALTIDKRRHEVWRASERIELTPLEYQILHLLASEPGRAWSRNELLDQVWSTDYEGYQRNIDPHIARLRKKVEPEPENPRYVLTVRGYGYKMNEQPDEGE